ncbi:hypothetical protein [Microbacterium sp. B19]|uniref:hypothetical protein n=1 Tax=Microbacterium sp. B19 TaxID=96765 RepID=UPI001EF9DB1C|nr:hypothetical protein [Microbacterium sp. B19]
MTSSSTPRWNDYVFTANTQDTVGLVKEAVGPDDVRTLLLCGGGFDPRTLHAPTAVAGIGVGDLRVLALRPNAQGSHADAKESATRNLQKLRDLFRENLEVVEAPQVAEPNSAATILTRKLVADHGLLEFDTVIVDMSGMPSSISFPIIHLLLNGSEDAGFRGNLLVLVSEDAETDRRIVRSEIGRPSVLNALTRLPSSRQPVIWIPILGEGAGEELSRIRVMLDPEEVCPVVPFPSTRARRADDLIVEHGDLLFEVLRFEPRNVLHASELNPFDVYRQMVSLARRYRAALSPLGSPTIATSEHGSKLMSLGVLLAAHEEDLVVAQVDTTSYDFASPDLASDRLPVLYGAWLTGSPYDVGTPGDG